MIAQRMDGQLDVSKIAAMSEDQFVTVCSERPVIHRFPAAMAEHIRHVCQVLTDATTAKPRKLGSDGEF